MLAKRAPSIALLAGLAAGALLTSNTAQAGQCPALAEQAATAEADGNLELLQSLHGKASAAGSGCDTTFTYCLGRRVARSFLNEAYSRADKGVPDHELLPLLKQGRKFGNPWQLLFAMGEAEEAAKEAGTSKFDRAAALYQETVNEIKEVEASGSICPGETEELPTAEQAEMIFKRATAASRLAKDFVAPPVMRNGDVGGIFIDSFRGYTPVQRPVPITFDYDKATMNHKGRKAAAFLLSFLNTKKPHTVHLTGHTDDKGSDAYNCDLSKRRLQTVKAYLAENNFKGQVVIQPLGEFLELKLDDPDRYSLDERRALNRRVELKLGSGAISVPGGRSCG